MTVISGLLAILLPASAYAGGIDEETLYFYGQNNIVMFDPSACSAVGLGAYNGDASDGLSDLQASFVDTYHDIAATLSVEYGIPWETVMAQGILESTSGTSNFAVTRNNFFGIGAFDSNTSDAYSYDTPEEGWRGYYENIKNTATYRNHGVFTGEAITNPYVYAQVIKDAGYATDVDYVAKLTKYISAVENRAAENGWQSSATLAALYPEMLTNAAANAAGADSSSSSGSVRIICSNYMGSGALVAGGMTLQEARERIMEPYRSIRPRSYQEAGGDILNRWSINDVCNSGKDCCVSDLENCVAFVQYFICEYANVCMGLPNGRDVVSKLISSGKGFTDGGTTPRPYAIFSTTRVTSGTSTGNHTGVILGIDKVRNKVIVGEAGCGSGLEVTNAHEYDLSKFVDGSHVYAYTDGLIGF